MYSEKTHRAVLEYLAAIADHSDPATRGDIAEHVFDDPPPRTKFVYRQLMQELIDAGYVKEVEGSGRSQFYYRITPLGRKAVY